MSRIQFLGLSEADSKELSRGDRRYKQYKRVTCGEHFTGLYHPCPNLNALTLHK